MKVNVVDDLIENVQEKLSVKVHESAENGASTSSRFFLAPSNVTDVRP